MNPVLLIAFRRWQNIDEILDRCRFAGVNRIYIHIDAGRNIRELADVAKTLERSIAYRHKWGLDIRIAKQNENIGCAVSVLASINKVFQFEERVVVLEDDCIPTADFFTYMTKSFSEMKKNSNIGLACGAQFAPKSVTQANWLLSSYPLNWGWGTTKSQWGLLSIKMISGENLYYKRGNITSRAETTYWNAGCRRAIQGYTDVWDTLLVREMLRSSIYSILPPYNLVLNVGNDEPALHTKKREPRINFPTGGFAPSSSSPSMLEYSDTWFRKSFFGISKRHLISTKITALKDRFLSRPKFKPLSERIQLASVNFDL